MKFHELQTAKTKTAKRVGRGISAGQGKTAGRGTKGQRARTGSNKKPGFTGGQNPLMQQLPKLPGFKSKRLPMENVFTDQLGALHDSTITNTVLAAAGLVSSAHTRVKVLSRGELNQKVIVQLQGASQTAIEAIQKAGGSFNIVARVPRPKTRTDTKPE